MSFKGSTNGPSETSVADVIELKSGQKLNRETPPTTREAEELAQQTRSKAATVGTEAEIIQFSGATDPEEESFEEVATEAHATLQRVKNGFYRNARHNVEFLIEHGLLERSQVIDNGEGDILVRTPEGVELVGDYYKKALEAYAETLD